MGQPTSVEGLDRQCFGLTPKASFLGKRNINNSILLADLIPPTFDPDYRFCLYRVCTLSL